MRRVVIVGARHRGWNPKRSYATQVASQADELFVRNMLDNFRKTYGEFAIISIGCDITFGKMVQSTCEDAGVPFIEVRIKRTKHVPKAIYEILHIARHGALMELGEEFHVFVTNKRISNVEDLVQRLELNPRERRLYRIYDEDLEVISTNAE